MIKEEGERVKRLIAKPKTIKLIHGTNSSIIDSVLKDGLLPEGLTGNAMFNYNDYGRKGEPKHADSIYLTDDLDAGIRYASNAVKHNDGFPVVLEMEVNESALSWDDDAFYKNYGDFDFGERDDETGEWIRKPSKDLWEQSLAINDQCTHAGTIEPSQFTRIYIENKWWSVDNFKNILDNYKDIKVNMTPLNEKDEINLKEFKMEIAKYGLSLTVSILGRRIYMYNLVENDKLDLISKTAVSIAIMEALKLSIKEFGAKIISSPELKRIGLNPKTSCFNYVFGSFDIKSDENILDELTEKVDRSFKDRDILKNIIDCKATDEDFNELYMYNPDFIDNLTTYCTGILNYDYNKVIETLNQISKNYHDAYEQLEAEVAYLEANKNKSS
jgi:hypothetical protein